MWKAFAEQFKECGRNGTLFIFAVVGAWPLLLLTSVLVEALGEWAWPIIGGAWLLAFSNGLAGFIQNWRHPDRLGKLPPLSQNDLRVARSKLMKHRHSR